MAHEIEIKEEAYLEIMAAYTYYEEKHKGLGEDFLEHLSGYFDTIATYPEHFPKKREPYREAFIKRFPYLIIYEVAAGKIIVYSVFNTWQDTDKKPG